MLPTENEARKALPVYDFLVGYFPAAFLEVVKVAVVGNQQHNPGEKLHWARHKSTDQLNTALRHILDHGTGNPLDVDGCYHLAKAIWRLSAELQLLVERTVSRVEPSLPAAGPQGEKYGPKWSANVPGPRHCVPARGLPPMAQQPAVPRRVLECDASTELSASGAVELLDDLDSA